jgi:hypothetical protein
MTVGMVGAYGGLNRWAQSSAKPNNSPEKVSSGMPHDVKPE